MPAGTATSYVSPMVASPAPAAPSVRNVAPPVATRVGRPVAPASRDASGAATRRADAPEEATSKTDQRVLDDRPAVEGAVPGVRGRFEALPGEPGGESGSGTDQRVRAERQRRGGPGRDDDDRHRGDDGDPDGGNVAPLHAGAPVDDVVEVLQRDRLSLPSSRVDEVDRIVVGVGVRRGHPGARREPVPTGQGPGTAVWRRRRDERRATRSRRRPTRSRRARPDRSVA